MMAFRNLLTIFGILIPVLLVGATVLTYSINLPYWDDYLVQSQLISLKSTPGVFHKIGRLFDQHWEHRIVWTRILFFLYYKLTSQLDYYGLTLVGVSGLVMLLALLYAAFRKTGLPLAYFLPVPFWLVTLESHENLTWAMASIQNFYILVFTFGALYALALETRRAFGLALGLAVMACFTSGNGFLLFVVGTLLLFWQAHYRRGLLWVLVGVGCVIGYFFNYHRVTFFPSPFLYGYGEWFKAFFVFAGAFVDTYPYTKPLAIGYENPVWLTIGLGIVLIGFATFHLFRLLLAGRRRFDARWSDTRRSLFSDNPFWNHFFAGSLLFLLATDAMTVYARVGFGGAGYLLQGRYKIYSPLFISICYLYYLWLNRTNPRLRVQWLAVTLLTIPVSLYADYQCLEGIINQHRKTVAAYVTWRLQTPEADQTAFNSVFHSADGAIPYLNALKTTPVPSTATVDHISEEHFFFDVVKTNAVNPPVAHPDEGSYVVMVGRDSTYVFAARPLRPYALPDSLTDKSKKNGYFSLVFQAQVPKETMRPGRYRMGLLTNQNQQFRFEMTPDSIYHTTTY